MKNRLTYIILINILILQILGCQVKLSERDKKIKEYISSYEQMYRIKPGSVKFDTIINGVYYFIDYSNSFYGSEDYGDDGKLDAVVRSPRAIEEAKNDNAKRLARQGIFKIISEINDTVFYEYESKKRKTKQRVYKKKYDNSAFNIFINNDTIKRGEDLNLTLKYEYDEISELIIHNYNFFIEDNGKLIVKSKAKSYIEKPYIHKKKCWQTGIKKIGGIVKIEYYSPFTKKEHNQELAFEYRYVVIP